MSLGQSSLSCLVALLLLAALAKASEIDYKMSVKQLLANLEFSMGLFKDPNSVSPDVLKWDLLSNNEIHIMLKLIRYLRRLVKSSDATVAKLIQGGFQCNAIHPAQQEAISRQVEMSICSEVEWYKTAQLTFPEAKTIIDVGGNKGYLGSLFVSLWGGGGYGVSPTALSSVFIKDKVWVRNPYGFCRDGLNNGLPLHCPPQYVKEPAFQNKGVCLYKRQGVTVTSFDGSSFLCQTLNDVMRHNMTDPQVRAHRVWKYVHSAAGDKVGVVAFTKQSRESRPGFEGGKMKQAHTEGQTELVNVTTIDSYAEARGLKVDLLKIDAEGADALVIRGALKTIYSTVGLVTFEGYGKGSLTETTISDFDAHGFSCYSTSLAGLFKWNGGCMRGSRKRATKGNIFCASRWVYLFLRHRYFSSQYASNAEITSLNPAPIIPSHSLTHRERAPLLSMAFDILSFPVMIDEEALRGEPSASFNASSIEMAELSKAFIQIKPLCAPYPACLKQELEQ